MSEIQGPYILNLGQTPEKATEFIPAFSILSPEPVGSVTIEPKPVPDTPAYDDAAERQQSIYEGVADDMRRGQVDPRPHAQSIKGVIDAATTAAKGLKNKRERAVAGEALAQGVRRSITETPGDEAAPAEDSMSGYTWKSTPDRTDEDGHIWRGSE